MKRSALTIASSDPSGGAGLEADLKTFTAHQVFGLTAIAAITLQDTRGVRGSRPADLETFGRTLEVLEQDLPIHAIKIGALSTRDHLEIVKAFLERLEPRPPTVLDPVIRSTSGAWLLAIDAIPHLAELLPLVSLVTPNLKEAGLLAQRPLRSIEDLHDAARIIAGLGAPAVLIKGGHMVGDSRDTLYHQERFTEWPNDIIPHEFHGTGCVLSAAIAARLARGHELEPAIAGAREWLRLAMLRATPGAGEAYILDFPPADF